jgi:hypothetical protein
LTTKAASVTIESMAKYCLPHPRRPREVLSKHGQVGSNPTLKASESNDYFSVMWGRNGARFLVPFDPTTGANDLTSMFPVPDDWSGEPDVYGINEDVFMDTVVAIDGRVGDIAAAERLHSQLATWLENGDVVVLHRAGRPVGRLGLVADAHGQFRVRAV